MTAAAYTLAQMRELLRLATELGYTDDIEHWQTEISNALAAIATPIPGCACTSCGHTFELASNIDNPEKAPQDGSISICIKCGGIDIFVNNDGTLTLRRPTPDERADIFQDQRINDTVAHILVRNALAAGGAS